MTVREFNGPRYRIDALGAGMALPPAANETEDDGDDRPGRDGPDAELTHYAER